MSRFTRFTFSIPDASTPDAKRLDASMSVCGVSRLPLSALTPELFEERFRAKGEPLVIEGVLPDDAASHWGLRTFAKLLDADRSYQCRIHGGDGQATTPRLWTGGTHARQTVRTDAATFATAIESGVAAREDAYVQHDIRGSAAAGMLAPALQRLAEATGLQIHAGFGPHVNMWWGPRGHTEPLHIDTADGTLLQLCGHKRVTLFPRDCWVDLYPFPPTKGGMSWAFSACSAAEREAADFERRPDLRCALPRAQHLRLRPGDALYIPACCAHEISGELSGAGGGAGTSSGAGSAAARQGEHNTGHVLSVNRFWATALERVLPFLPPDAACEYLASPGASTYTTTCTAQRRTSSDG